jgi:hypothetical protein
VKDGLPVDGTVGSKVSGTDDPSDGSLQLAVKVDVLVQLSAVTLLPNAHAVTCAAGGQHMCH